MKKLAAILLTFLMAIGISSCGKKENVITIHDSQFAEGQIIHQAVKILVEKDTPLTVNVRDEMSMVNNYNDMIQGGSDLMNCYDGTLLSTFLKKDVSDVPVGETIYSYSNTLVQQEQGFEMLGELGHENTYALAVTQELAEELNLETISDLIPHASKLIFGAEHDFFSMEGSMKYGPFSSYYGLAFKDARPIDLFIKYNAIEHNNIDVTVVYSTDGLNKKAGLKILEDDQRFFPDYNGALLVRSDLFAEYEHNAPNLKEILSTLDDMFTNESMLDLTYQVDVEGRQPKDIAEEFLEKKGLI